jgi:hypothetical protein
MPMVGERYAAAPGPVPTRAAPSVGTVRRWVGAATSTAHAGG